MKDQLNSGTANGENNFEVFIHYVLLINAVYFLYVLSLRLSACQKLKLLGYGFTIYTRIDKGMNSRRDSLQDL